MGGQHLRAGKEKKKTLTNARNRGAKEKLESKGGEEEKKNPRQAAGQLRKKEYSCLYALLGNGKAIGGCSLGIRKNPP